MAEVEPTEGSHTINFGSFRLHPAQRLLREGDKRIDLGSRAMEILVALVERPGQLVSKDELMSRVWPNTFVEEANLRVNIALLRRVLRDGQDGNRYIGTDPGRGYRFIAPLSVVAMEANAAPIAAVPPIDTLPVVFSRVIGREPTIATVTAQLPQRRFITLVGPGGIGKTTVAIAVARNLAASYRDGVAFLDLAPINDPSHLPSALATMLGLSISSDNRMPGLLAHLKNRQMLLVFDCCEHVIAAAAALAEAISQAAADVHILATSREPLRAAGERVHRLPPLENPTASVLTAEEALAFPGVQLFVERAAAANLDGFALHDTDAPTVAEICRRLDGIPLAIELATGCINAIGIRELAARLDDRFRLLRSGRRTALPRHQTLSATLDWSFHLLPEEERELLERLSVFAGGFSLASALAVAGENDASQALLLAGLVEKSLVAFDQRGEFEHYRLLDSTRLYALEKLQQREARHDASGRHAEHYRKLFERAEADCETLSPTEWRATYAHHIGNVRAALLWAFSAEGDPSAGVLLAANVVQLWVQLSLMGECRAWAERALAHLDAAGETMTPARMRLSAALGWSLMFAVGTARATREAWNTTLELAETLDDTGYRLRGLWGLWVDRLNNGALNAALDLAQRFAALVASSAAVADQMMADRMLATSLHFLGNQQPARHHIEGMLARYAASARQPAGGRFQFHQQVTAHYFQARILWLLGFADQAMRIVKSNIDEARVIGNALSLGSVLGQGACPIALLSGDLDAAEHYGNLLLDHAVTHALHIWETWARCFNAVVMVRHGQVDVGIRGLQAQIATIGESLMLPRYLFLLGELSMCLAEAGDVARGLRTVGDAITRCEASGERWYLAELWRIKGELTRLDHSAGIATNAEAHFLRALELAREQQARAWELRAAISLVRLRQDQGGMESARSDLSRVYDTFTEGFSTKDLRLARTLLAEAA
jgi:predicted ATPase/DNA-binding winged helix-turn-helix (wHTH) protein